MNTCPPSRFRHLLAATLAIGSTFQFVLPVLAQSTAAGTAIKNTATGTFTDGTTNYNTTSNEVTIEVSEIAGIELMAQTPSKLNPNEGDTLYVDFVVANTGNDPTQFFIPGTATLSNTTAFAQDGQIQIVAVNGSPLGTFANVPNAGESTATLLGNPTIPVNPGTGTTGTITIRVPIKVLTSAISGNTLTVSLGNTATKDDQNVALTNPGVDTTKLYTVDNNSGVGGETNATVPSNGTREAMATSSTITVAARLQAFAAVLKAIGGYSNNSTPNNLADDVLTYRLSLKVDNPTPPPAGLVASDLYGTQLNVNNSTAVSYVLVSDAIPTGLQLGATAAIVAPTGWTPVYTKDSLTTTTALTAQWSTTRPAETAASPITRIGFIYNSTTTPLSRGSVGVGTTISGFEFAMNPLAGFTGGQVANIAQVFGQSQRGTVAPGTSTQIVYDESGDQTTNNGLGGDNPSALTGANGGITNGAADTTADGIDPGTGSDPSNTGNTNQGVDTGATKTIGGEDTVYTIAATPLNGPFGQPGATGTTGTNDDFTNKSIVVPPNTPPGDAIDAAAVTFDNTVQNTSSGSQPISLLPTPPATATDLPNGTLVTITDPATGGSSATYSYNSTGGFTFVSGTGTATATNPVKITVPGGGTAPYTVTIDLPSAAQLKGYPVPITAFVDTNNDGSPANDPSNITIDRLYTNYVSLVKDARVLEANGTPVSGPAGTYTTVQADLSAAATPGRIIEYRITYQNISTSGGTNSVTLPANNLLIKENGAAGTNNWGSTTLDPAFPTTGGNGSATASGGTIAVTPGGTPADIQEYRNTVLTVAPGSAAGTFIFQRKIK
jgi:hypothetical protein